jgi:hypothetical protein
MKFFTLPRVSALKYDDRALARHLGRAPDPEEIKFEARRHCPPLYQSAALPETFLFAFLIMLEEGPGTVRCCNVQDSCHY